MITKNFFKFMKERHQIYLNREAGKPFPWTDDPILQKYSFTNVYRELDRTTIWIRENWREPFADHPNLWFAMCVARTFNYIDTLEEIGFPKDGWDAEKVAKIIRSRIDRGEKAYTGAYMIRAESDRKKPWFDWPKERYITEIVLGRVWDNRHYLETEIQSNSLERSHRALNKMYGWGGLGFMAYEVITDLRHTRYLNKAHDIMTWGNAGPGAHRGLDRIHGRPVKQKGISEKQQPRAVREMRELLALSQLEENWPNNSDFPPLEMRCVEHSLCEAAKYWKVQHGEGKPRSGYSPPPDFKEAA